MDAKMLAALEAQPPIPVEEADRYYKGFLYGDFGVGKTVIAAACARNKGLIVATDTGVESLHNHPDIRAKMEMRPYDGLSQLTALGLAKTEKLDSYSQFDLYLIDTISQVQEEYLDYLNENFSYTGAMRETAKPRTGVKNEKEQEITGLADYHLTRNNMRRPIKALIKAPIDVIFIAHLREPNFMEKSSGKLVRRPTLTESVFKLIAREATWMGLMERKGTKRTIQFMTDPKTTCKSRIKALDEKTIDADELPKILHAWKEGK